MIPDKNIDSHKLEMLGQMTGAILHDLKGPLSFIKSNNTHLIKKLRKVDKISIKQIDELISILIENEEGLNYMNAILRETGHLLKRDKYSNHSLHEIIKASKVLSECHIKRTCKLELNLNAKDDYIYGSNSQLRQVFINLFINASEAFNQYSTQNIITVTSSLNKDLLMVNIKDNGSGISKEKLPVIFNWYESSKKNGTGQGLPIVKKLLTKHEADIKCRSSLNKGTEFTLTFPRVK